jgi:hypothetical protein
MADITTTRIFSDGEKGITAAKMNDIIASSSIQTAFYTSKPASTTLDPTDLLLEYKAAGSYATITGDQLTTSVSNAVTPNMKPLIWSVRQRSFNAVGNPTMEVSQRNLLNALTLSTTNQFPVDRWQAFKSGTMTATTQSVGANINVPGTSFCITRRILTTTIGTAQTILGVNDYLGFQQVVEGPNLRELINDVHSISLLVRSSVANLKFSVSLGDPPTQTKVLAKLCSLGAANTWTLIMLPNLPVWPSGNFSTGEGLAGYYLYIHLAGGTGQMVAANDTWQSTSIGWVAAGTSNFAAIAGSTFDLAFVQHEPGPDCSGLIDCPFAQNYDACLRYFTKSYNYAIKPGTVNASGNIVGAALASNNPYIYTPYKKPMAKDPGAGIIPYSPSTGAASNVRDVTANVDRGATAVNNSGEVGFGGFAISTLNASNAIYGWHYTADTGW